MGVLDPGQGAAGKKSDRHAANRGGAGKAVRRTAEVVDQRVIPVAPEFSQDADARAAQIDPVVEPLRHGRGSVGMIVVTTAIEMDAASNRNAILIVCAT